MANKYASYTVRLNWKTDLDLIAMFKHPDFNFAKFMRMAIVAFVRGDDDFYIISKEEVTLPLQNARRFVSETERYLKGIYAE